MIDPSLAPHYPDDHPHWTSDAAREAILALPPLTLIRAGWRTAPDRVQGSLHWRTGEGLGPIGRDETTRSVLFHVTRSVDRMANPDQRWDFEIVASPANARLYEAAVAFDLDYTTPEWEYDTDENERLRRDLRSAIAAVRS